MTRGEKVTLNISPKDQRCESHLAQGLDTIWIDTCHCQGHWLRSEAEPLDPNDRPHTQSTKLEHLASVEGATLVLLGWQKEHVTLVYVYVQVFVLVFLLKSHMPMLYMYSLHCDNTKLPWYT